MFFFPELNRGVVWNRAGRRTWRITIIIPKFRLVWHTFLPKTVFQNLHKSVIIELRRLQEGTWPNTLISEFWEKYGRETRPSGDGGKWAGVRKVLIDGAFVAIFSSEPRGKLRDGHLHKHLHGCQRTRRMAAVCISRRNRPRTPTATPPPYILFFFWNSLYFLEIESQPSTPQPPIYDTARRLSYEIANPTAVGL